MDKIIPFFSNFLLSSEHLTEHFNYFYQPLSFMVAVSMKIILSDDDI